MALYFSAITPAIQSIETTVTTHRNAKRSFKGEATASKTRQSVSNVFLMTNINEEDIVSVDPTKRQATIESQNICTINFDAQSWDTLARNISNGLTKAFSSVPLNMPSNFTNSEKEEALKKLTLIDQEMLSQRILKLTIEEAIGSNSSIITNPAKPSEVFCVQKQKPPTKYFVPGLHTSRYYIYTTKTGNDQVEWCLDIKRNGRIFYKLCPIKTPIDENIPYIFGRAKSLMG